MGGLYLYFRVPIFSVLASFTRRKSIQSIIQNMIFQNIQFKKYSKLSFPKILNSKISHFRIYEEIQFKNIIQNRFFSWIQFKKIFHTGFFLGFNSKKYSFNTKIGVPPMAKPE